MKGIRRFAPLVCILLLLLAAYALMPRAGKAVYGQNLLMNGDFEMLDGENSPESWYPNAYVQTRGVSLYTVAEGVSGKGARIENVAPNDARYMQTVPVVPNTAYCLEGDILSAAQGGRGANLSVAGVYAFTQSVFEGEGWRHVRLYGLTGAKQKEATVYARLGGYSGESTGSAVFDNVRFYAVESVPEGESLFSLEETIGKEAGETAEKESGSAWPVLALTALLYLAFAFVLLRAAAQGKAVNAHLPTALALLAAAFCVRLAVALTVPGYQVDIGCFTAWANRMAEVGPAEFYLGGIHSDYPPGYMLVLWPLGLLGRLFGTGATEWMVKMPPILCDLLAVWLLYAKAPDKSLWGLAPAVLYALNPLTVLTGAAWGQADSVTALLILLTVRAAAGGKWIKALPVYTLSVLMKPQALMFGPLGLLALVMDFFWRRDPKKLADVLRGAALSLAVLAAVCLPFSLKQTSADWLIRLYTGTMTYYDRASVNMTNLYFLFSLNWAGLDTRAALLLKAAGALALLVPAATYAAMETKRGRALPKMLRYAMACAACLCLVLLAAPVSVGLAGPLLMAAAFILLAAQYVRGREIRLLPFYGAVMLMAFSTLGVMMHERYMFPALLLLFAAFAFTRDKRVLRLALALTALVFMNVGLVLDRAVRIGGAEGHLYAPLFGIQSESALLEMVLSALHVAVAGWAVYLGFSVGDGRKTPAPLVKGGQPSARPLPSFCAPAPLPKTTRRDAAVMLAVTLVYAAVALAGLGSVKAPQTAWVSHGETEELVFDLGAPRRFRVLYYPGIQWADSSFTVASGNSLDGLTSHPAEVLRGDCFAWKWQKSAGAITVHEGRYAVLKPAVFGMKLYEILFQDADTGKTLPAVLSAARNNGENGAEDSEEYRLAAAALTDEQDTLVNEPMLFPVSAEENGLLSDGLPKDALRPSWYNSTYFDEIYHARTGFEQLNALLGREDSAIYEVSHPPLGKALMTLAISVFGMTPFGWRFAGAMAGVLMLPAMYLFARLLTRRRWPGVLAMVLMAADMMHFAQTRIATIDSFVTLFIIWATYFMARYVLMDTEGVPLRKTLSPLFFSGLFMGLAIAAKWTGMYAGAGLAVMFFCAFIRNVRRGMAARRQMESGGTEGMSERARQIARDWDRRAVLTLLACVAFFILVPALIYYLSFYPVFASTYQGLTVKKVIDASVSMFNYHNDSTLGMDHPYRSEWYKWPIGQKPMWYYSSAKLGGLGSTIFAFGNPLVWWGGLLALLYVLGCLAWQGIRRLRGEGISADTAMLLVALGFAAQYLPWVLVSRSTYIYHYFPSVPFLTLAFALAAGRAMGRWPRAGRAAVYATMALAVLLFIGFYPYASGLRVPFGWLDMMRWLPGIWY